MTSAFVWQFVQKGSFSFVFCEICYFSFISMLEKKTKTTTTTKKTRYQKKLDLSMSVVSSNNESEVSQKKELGWLGVSLVQMGMNSFM